MPINDIAVIRRNFRAVLRDDRVTISEAERLIRSVSRDKVTQSERRQFREAFYANRDKFDTDAQTRMNQFIDNEIPQILIPDEILGTGGRGTIADPQVLKEHVGTMQWSSISGRVFVNGVSGDDVKQGYIGDCYFAAAISAVAHAQPEVVRNAFTENANGTLTVRFYESAGWNQPMRPVDITIDGDLPLQYGGLLYAHARDPDELWVPLLEKAYAQWKGGYEAIGNGGNPGAVMEALTGKPSDSTYLSAGYNDDAVFAALRAATQQGRPVAAATYDEHSQVKYDGTGIYADHTYAIFGVREIRGKRYVQLRNPWGEVEPGNDGRDDGIFLLPLDRFMQLFASVDVIQQVH